MLKEEKRFLRSASFETLPEKLERAAAWEREPLILSSIPTEPLFLAISLEASRADGLFDYRFCSNIFPMQCLWIPHCIYICLWPLT